jgi:hypothetical protein
MEKSASVARNPRYWASLAVLLVGLVLEAVSLGVLQHGSSAGGVTQPAETCVIGRFFAILFRT